ncbi:MAG: glucosaminidase domain-containing protein [Chloroflexi bacterium]|nr:glucosaminidase domain-containing protein [Chloroflexota bacterium]
MLGLLCTTTALRTQLPAALVARARELRRSATLARRRSPRPMARRVAMPASLALATTAAGAVSLSSASTMAVPMASLERGAPSWSTLLLATMALMLATAGLWRQDAVLSVTRIALDGLRDHEVLAVEIDGADRPAMDPRLAYVLDPRSRPLEPGAGRLRRIGVQPFEYAVREGETVQEIAIRFGVDVSALLWNNGLDDAEQVQPGARLMILPVRGVLHLVKDDETVESIAARYGSRAADILTANALDGLARLTAGQILVVAGGTVPMPVALTPPSAGEPLALTVADTALLEAEAEAAPTATSAPAPEILPEPPGAADWQRDFIMKIAPGARASMRKTGVPASVALAQAILESDWGRSKLTREANNLFGIKAYRDPGSAGIYEINTWEVIGGRNVTVLAAFKAYTTLADSIVDHGNWFHDNRRYADALAVRANPRAFAYAINAAGYATDPAYAPKLIQLMDRFNLYAYDVRDGE